MGFSADEFNALIKEYLETENEYQSGFLQSEINEMVKAVAEEWLNGKGRSFNFSKPDKDIIVSNVVANVLRNIAVDNQEKKKKWLITITENGAKSYWRKINTKKRKCEVLGGDEFWKIIDGLQHQTGKVKKNNSRKNSEDDGQICEASSDKNTRKGPVNTGGITTSSLSFESVLTNICKMRSEPKNKIAFLLRISRTAVFDSCYNMDLDMMKEIVSEISSLDSEEEIRNVFEQEFGEEDSFYIMKTLERIFNHAEKKEICSIRENVEPIWKEQIREKLEKEAEEHTILKSIYEVINRDPIEEVLEGKEYFKAATLVKNAIVFALRRKIPAEVFEALDEQLKAEKDGVIVGKTLIHFSDRDVKDSASYIKKQITKKYMS